MIIDLSDDARIVGTDLCWELQHWRSDTKAAGGYRWRPSKYFQTLGAAVRWAAHAEIRTDPASTLAEALGAVRSVMARYDRLLDDALGEIETRAEDAA